MIDYINLLVLIIVLIIVAILFLKKKNDGDVYSKSDHEGFKDDIIKDIKDKVDKVKDDLSDTLTKIKTAAAKDQGILETKSDQIYKAHQRLVDDITGSKRFGQTAELLLENLFKNSGLVYEKQWVKNLTFKKDGKSYTVEFAIKHPTGLYLPVDAHWPKTSYENLLELRKQETTSEIEQQRLKKEKDDLFRKIINDYRDKAKDVKKKYIDNSISAGFACIYIPSESLYHEITTHINEEKQLWISTLQKATKVTFMGPSTFAAYCGALLLGFNQIEGDQKAKMFIKHLEALTNSINDLNDATSKHENNVKKTYTDAQGIQMAAEKMKTNMEKITEDINSIEENKN